MRWRRIGVYAGLEEVGDSNEETKASLNRQCNGEREVRGEGNVFAWFIELAVRREAWAKRGWGKMI